MSNLVPNPPNQLSFPKVNGVMASYASMSLQIANLWGTLPLQLLDVQSIDYSDKVDMRFHWMTSSFPLARYGRRMGAEGSIDLGIETHRAVISALSKLGAGGISDVTFDIDVVYQIQPGTAVQIDVLHGCRIMGNGQRNVVGGKHLSTTCPLSVTWIEWNANTIFADAATGVPMVAAPAVPKIPGG
jgi:hypothetical protein